MHTRKDVALDVFVENKCVTFDKSRALQITHAIPELAAVCIVDELIEFAEEGNKPQNRRVIDVLRAAREIVAVQDLFGNGDTGWTLDRLSPLWTWLQSNRRGLVQADGEGYYDGHDLILTLG